MMEESVTLQVELPRRVYDFLKNQAKERNKTVEEYLDFIVQVDIAGTLLCIVSDQGGDPEELAFDLGLDGYISEGKRQCVGYEPVL
jgi:hypothetical protein